MLQRGKLCQAFVKNRCVAIARSWMEGFLEVQTTGPGEYVNCRSSSRHHRLFRQ